MTKRFDAMTPRAGREGKTYWHKVGIGIEGDKGVTVYLDSLPIPDKEGRVAIMLFEPREKSGDGTPKPAPAAKRGGMDDEIPF